MKNEEVRRGKPRIFNYNSQRGSIKQVRVMAASEAVLQVVCGSSSYDFHYVRSNKSKGFNTRKRSSVHVQAQISSRQFHASKGKHVFHGTNKLESLVCNCKRVERVNGNTNNDHKGAQSKLDKRQNSGSLDEIVTESARRGEVMGLDVVVKHDNGGVTSKDKLHIDGLRRDSLNKFSENSIEDEAWDLLRNSFVYYCNNNPIGTIAANDPSSTVILNYDQVFICDLYLLG
ncbi:Alkaline/neutral invertase E [Arachis hypogaea]|uniref:Alkaline/neutral invertase n=1 Tax=Arachis hypogaea TaxID=3818 RepID=A0A444Y7D2_ARAHY|nr:Alkaline/neutral invertase E [Arachis hypogaea]RYQ97862.1 hypothetical protein Ahy_B08g093931 isoform A [Arachis hypogaea]